MRRSGSPPGRDYGGMTVDAPPTLDDFLDASTIAALKAPSLAEARGLPAGVYTSEGFFALEQRRLFPRTWTGVAFDADVPAPGDAVPVSVAGVPLVILRDESGTVRAFHNVCRHRATIVLTEPCRGLRQLRCPYHAWTYGLDGALLATPFWDGTAAADRLPVDAGANGLVPVRCGVWNHVIFVNLAGDAPPLEEYLAPMAAEFSHLDMDALRCGYRTSWEFEANWKLVMDNWEVYHHVWVHEGIFERMSDEVDLETGEPFTDAVADGNVMILRANARRPERRPDTAANGNALPLLPPLPSPGGRAQKHGMANAVLPNTTLTLGPSAYVPAFYTPVAPGVTRAEMAWYFAPEAATGPEHAAARGATLDRWLGPGRSLRDGRGIRAQDHRCMELQQAARRSPVADDVKFSPVWEADVRYFQTWLVDRLR